MADFEREASSAEFGRYFQPTNTLALRHTRPTAQPGMGLGTALRVRLQDATGLVHATTWIRLNESSRSA